MAGADAGPGWVPATPVFVWESGDLSAFSSVEDVVLALEPVDVEDGIYVAYDGEGRLLRLTATGVKRRLGGIVVDQSNAAILVEPAEAEPGHRDELQRILVTHLRAIGHDEKILEELGFRELATLAARTGRVEVKRSWHSPKSRRC